MGIALAMIGGSTIASADDKPVPKEDATTEKQDEAREMKDDREVSLENLPKQAKATIEKQTAGGMLLEIEEETRANQTVYEVEYRDAKNQRFELVVADDGKLLDKRRD
jgi:uncharacterized membrane protein YkoI